VQVPARPICLEERVPHHAPDSTQVQEELLRAEWAMEMFGGFGAVGAAEAETLIVVVVTDMRLVVTVVVESAQTRDNSAMKGRASNIFECIFARVVWRIKMLILGKDKPLVFLLRVREVFVPFGDTVLDFLFLVGKRKT